MSEHVITLEINEDLERNELRKRVINKFMEEEAGTGNGELTSRYRYNVENLSNGNRVYLTRPVPLNKGFDFVIHVENQRFSNNKDNPKHQDIIEDIKNKKEENSEQFDELIELINKVANCKDPSQLLNETSLNFETGLSTESLLKTIKWLFIEQDIRYWNWSGRFMFLKEINKLKEN